MLLYSEKKSIQISTFGILSRPHAIHLALHTFANTLHSSKNSFYAEQKLKMKSLDGQPNHKCILFNFILRFSYFENLKIV